MEILFLIITISYILLLSASLYGWQKREQKTTQNMHTPFCSILLSVRNEENSIQMLLQDLIEQDYQTQNFEILIANDHSTDSTEQIIREFSKKAPNIFLYNVPSEYTGKKQAIQYILTKAKGELLLFTDADCSISNKWISTYVKFAEHNPGNLYFGLVSHTQEKTFIQKFFTLDFLGIIIVQAGLAKLKKAFSCNAANMCITRDFYTSSYKTNETFASGDDVFLLHTAKAKNPKSVYFIQQKDVIVQTSAPKTLHTFISQRIRWASKASGYKDTIAILVTYIVFLFNFTIFTTGVFACFSSHFINTFLLLITIKTISDLLFFSCTLPYFNKQKLLLLVIPFQFFYSIYITIIPIFAILFPVSWKGRKIK